MRWLVLHQGQVTESDVATLAPLMQSQSGIARFLPDSGAIRILATYYAEAGKTAEALSTLGQAMDAGARRQLDPDDWYVLGRIYEHYGERASAEAAYKRVLNRQGARPTLFSAYTLAQKRLDLLAAELK